MQTLAGGIGSFKSTQRLIQRIRDALNGGGDEGETLDGVIKTDVDLSS